MKRAVRAGRRAMASAKAARTEGRASGCDCREASMRMPASPISRPRRFRPSASARRVSGAPPRCWKITPNSSPTLIACNGEARTTDIAERLGVAHPTASKAIARLKREGLAVARPYRGVFLTEAGKAMAERSRQRHRLVVDFLLRGRRAAGSGRSRRRGPRALRLADDAARFCRIREIARAERAAPLSCCRSAMPAASTSPPPSMTLAAAESGGVSI